MKYALGFGAPTPNVTRFLIIIIALYLIFALFAGQPVARLVYGALVLSPREAIFSFELWRLITYAFLHDLGSPMHVIFNGLMLYMLGPSVEEHFGERRFFIFVMVAIFLGGILVCLSFLLGLSYANVVGFSAATIGLLIAWGLSFSRQQIYILGIFPLSGQQLVYVTIGLEIIYAVSSKSISSAAHFGGILAGFIFALGLYKPRRIKELWNRSKKTQFRR